MTSIVNWMNNTEIADYWLHYNRLSDAFYIATGVWITIFIVLAMIGNILTILVFVRSQQLEFVSNWFLMNMAVADLLACCLCYPMVVIASFSGHWQFGHIGCFAYCIMVGTCNFATIGSMALVAIDRSLVIRRCTGNGPLGRSVIGSCLSRKVARLLIIFIWLYSVSLVLPPIFGWGNYILDAMEVSCTFDYVSDDPTAPFFVLLLFGCGFCTPLTVIVVCYVYIFNRLYRHRQTTQNILRANPPSFSNRVPDTKMVKMGATIVVMFVIAWLPYGVLAMAGAFGRVQISPRFQMVAELFAKASAMYNPFIYSMSHPDFTRKVRNIVGRSPVLSMICCLCFRRKVTRENRHSLNEMELEISMNVNVRRKTSQWDRGNRMVNQSMGDLEVKQTMTILNGLDDRPIYLEQVMIQHSPSSASS